MLGDKYNGEIQGRGGEGECRGYNLKKGVRGCAELWNALLRSHFRTEGLSPPAAEKNHFIQDYDSFLGRPTPND